MIIMWASLAALSSCNEAAVCQLEILDNYQEAYVKREEVPHRRLLCRILDEACPNNQLS
jgi:hypothetical protein